MIASADELGSPEEPENAAGDPSLEGVEKGFETSYGSTGDERAKLPTDDAPADAAAIDAAQGGRAISAGVTAGEEAAQSGGGNDGGAGSDGAEEDPSERKDWYILKVQSNREDSIRDALMRRIKIHGLERYVDQVIVPTEKISQINPKTGKKRTIKQKLYPGYLVVHMAINDDTWFLIRETPGIGDFTGSGGKPVPMKEHEVARIVAKTEDQPAETVKIKIDLKQGERVKIIDGIFLNFEGDVDTVDENSGKITVLINIFNRSTPVDLEYWQVEKL